MKGSLERKPSCCLSLLLPLPCCPAHFCCFPPAAPLLLPLSCRPSPALLHAEGQGQGPMGWAVPTGADDARGRKGRGAGRRGGGQGAGGAGGREAAGADDTQQTGAEGGERGGAEAGRGRRRGGSSDARAAGEEGAESERAGESGHTSASQTASPSTRRASTSSARRGSSTMMAAARPPRRGSGGRRRKKRERGRNNANEARRSVLVSQSSKIQLSPPRFVTIGTAGPMLTRPVGFPRISSQTRPGKERKKSVNSRKWGKAIWRNFDRRLFCVCGLLSLPFA